MLSGVVTYSCVRNSDGHPESNPRSSAEGATLRYVLRTLKPQHVGLVDQAVLFLARHGDAGRMLALFSLAWCTVLSLVAGTNVGSDLRPFVGLVFPCQVQAYKSTSTPTTTMHCRHQTAPKYGYG